MNSAGEQQGSAIGADIDPTVVSPRAHSGSSLSFASGRTPGRAGKTKLLPEGLRVVPGRAGDHFSIFQLLTAVFHGPSAAEFQASLDQPQYEPQDRLIVKRRGRVLAHIHLTKRLIHFGTSQISIINLQDLATLPEHRGHGLAQSLLAEAERQSAAENALVATLQTRIPAFFQRSGWTLGERHSYSRASARDILSYLGTVEEQRAPVLLGQSKPPLNIRLFRQVEQDALMRLYQQNMSQAFGSLNRSESYWRWLISRRGFDRIYVAIDGPDKLELNETASPIVGYAVTKQGRIVELHVVPGHTTVARQLIARACSDAIEWDYHTVQLDAAPSDPLHQIFQSAGGECVCHESDHDEVFMVKLLDPATFLERIGPVILGRVQAAGLPIPCELGLAAAGEKFRIEIGSRTVRLTTGRLGRSYLSCDSDALTQMLLGHLDVRQAVQDGRIEASTRVARETGAMVFPRLPYWRTPLDDLPATG